MKTKLLAGLSGIACLVAVAGCGTNAVAASSNNVTSNTVQSNTAPSNTVSTHHVKDSAKPSLVSASSTVVASNSGTSIGGFTTFTPPDPKMIPYLTDVAKSFYDYNYLNQANPVYSAGSSAGFINMKVDGVTFQLMPVRYTFGTLQNGYQGTTWSFEVSVVNQPSGFQPTEQSLTDIATQLASDLPIMSGPPNVAMMSDLNKYQSLPDASSYFGNVMVIFQDLTGGGFAYELNEQDQGGWIVNGQVTPNVEPSIYQWLLQAFNVSAP